ncbi:MAG: hypothetical protein ABIW47_07310 [Ginsengibacter sp.]|jgi:hypothetical protein
MNLNFQYLIPTEFDENSRVWVYQSNRQFDVNESLQIEDILQNFCKEWNSHGSSVKGYANLFFGHFIIIMADEAHTKVGGCSTDSSVRLIKSLEQDFNVQLTDRMLLAFILKERIELLSIEEINLALEDTFISGDTLYFNNTILTKKDLLTKWIIPVRESWLAQRIPSLI